MEAILASQLPKITALCDRFGVAHMELFGSAANGNFMPASSDYDFLVELDDAREGSKALRWVELAEELEKLLGRHVDLVNPTYIENPFFRSAVDNSRITIYDRKSSETPA
jgi:uncharacterized protein